MSTVQNTTSAVSDSLLAAVNGKSSTSSSSTNSTTEIEDRFLKLLVAQMKNQDPLNPLDNAQVTSQMAQLSTVSGINNLNAALQALQATTLSSQALDAAGMIGHSVLVSGSAVSLSDGKATLGFDLASAAEYVKVTIKDAKGNAVYTTNLEASKAGIQTMTWDGKTDSGGKAADGYYTFEVAATSAGKSVKSSTLSFGEVNSITSTGTGISLNLPKIGSVKLTDIRQIL